MMVRDGVIMAVGPSDEIARQLPNDVEIVDAGDRIVLPGFVDAHAHPVFGGNRVDEFEMRARGATYEEIAAQGGGIRSTVRKTRAASEAQLLAHAQKRANWFLRCGTTTMEAKSGYNVAAGTQPDGQGGQADRTRSEAVGHAWQYDPGCQAVQFN